MRLSPAAVMVAAAVSAALLFAISPTSRSAVEADCSASSPCPTPSPTPPPTPPPVNAFLSLDVSAGPPDTQITVNGGAFLPNEQMTLYWDTSNKVAGGANADGSGNFTTHVKPFASDALGVHRLYASVPPYPFANFTLQAATPTPSPSPSSSPEPSPSESPSPTATDLASPSPVATTLNGLDVMTRPPFVFIPIIGALAILLSFGYWIFTMVRRPQPRTLSTAAVMHRATRPDYTAELGTPPPKPAPAGPPASAWADALPPAPTPSPGPAIEPGRTAEEAQPLEPEPPPPSAWSEPDSTMPQSTAPGVPERDLPSSPDEPPDLPEPSDD
ncbi:MAG: hypothetical protein ACREOM_12885 [Candidatus Dormibacteraceae bacterium]